MAMRGSSNGSLMFGAPLLRFRDAPLQPCHKIQARRREAEYFFIRPVERVAQVAVRRESARQAVVHVDADVGESRIPEESVRRAEVRLFVQRLAAEVAGEIGSDA